MNRDPCSLADAQQPVEAHEQNFKATVGRENEMKSRARHVSWTSDGDNSEGSTVCRVQTPQYVPAEQFTALTNQVKSLAHTVEKLQLHFEHFQSTRRTSSRRQSERWCENIPRAGGSQTSKIQEVVKKTVGYKLIHA